MRSPARRCFTLAIVLMLAIGHVAGLQLIAWTSMFIDRVQTATVTEAITSTFDGSRPCAICHAAYPGDMLSIADVMPKGAWHDRVTKWKKTSAKTGSKLIADAIPIANLGQANNWAYLDSHQTTAKTKEMAVVESDPEDTDVFPNVLAFLRECLATVHYGLDEAAEVEG